MIKLLLQMPSYFGQILEIIPLHVKGNQFIKDNKLWKGLFELKWVLWLSIGLGLIVSFLFINACYAWMKELFFTDHGDLGIFSSSTLSSSFNVFGQAIAIDGGLKYLILIFADVIIFHCTVTTVNILSGNTQKPSFRDFVNAEKRMIRVSFTAWILEMIAGIIVAVILGIIGLDFLKDIVLLILEFYFIGHLFLDNYNEQYGLSVKESFNVIKVHAGAAIGIGFVAYILFFIPIVGLVVAPILGAVTGAIYMYSKNVNAELERDLELV